MYIKAYYNYTYRGKNELIRNFTTIAIGNDISPTLKALCHLKNTSQRRLVEGLILNEVKRIFSMSQDQIEGEFLPHQVKQMLREIPKSYER